jgi:serine/threonine-protein kinase HipA
MKLLNCPGCLRPYEKGYCIVCRKLLFGGKNISPILPFTRPDFNRAKNNPSSRISISGAQIKHSLKLTGKTLELTDVGGEYILKPIPNDTFENLAEIPINEHVTMQAARQVFGMKVAANALIYFPDGDPAYLTKRFDRGRDGTRFLQEDFAQLSSRSEESHGEAYKYTGSYEEIAGLMKRFVGPYAVEVERLFAHLLFNCLILNGDAHLKNFSLYKNPEDGIYRLTPAYDILNTRFHLSNEASDTALDLFKDDFETMSYKTNAFYAKDDFFLFGERIGMKPVRINMLLEKFSSGYAGLESLIQRSAFKESSKSLYLDMVRDRIKRLRITHEKPV